MEQERRSQQYQMILAQKQRINDSDWVIFYIFILYFFDYVHVITSFDYHMYRYYFIFLNNFPIYSTLFTNIVQVIVIVYLSWVMKIM